MQKLIGFVVVFSLLSFVAVQSHSQQAKSEAQKKSGAQKQKVIPPNQGNMLRARQSIEVARKELVQSGGEWGGHRMAAINHLDEALKEIGKAEAYAREHKEIK